jgi:hypothetical protein
MPHLTAVERQDWTIAKSTRPWRVRQQPPQVRLLDFDGPDSVLGLVAGEPDGQVGGEAQDHVLVAAEAASQSQVKT